MTSSPSRAVSSGGPSWGFCRQPAGPRSNARVASVESEEIAAIAGFEKEDSNGKAVRLAIAKSVIAFYQKYHDEATKRELKELLIQYDKGLLVADPRRQEPKKFGGHGTRARFQKSYR